MTDIWAVVHDERQALIADLEGIDDRDWVTPSLCSDWTIHDVLAHLVATAKDTVPAFLRDMVRARFDFDRTNAMGIAREKADDPSETLARFSAVIDRTSSPPAPRATRLIEAIVHGEDIRRPLGITREYPIEAVVRSLQSQASTSSAAMGGGKALVEGLTLAATDTELTLGSGPNVNGTVLALLLVTSGRSVALADLSGPGIDRLAERLGEVPE